MKLNTFNLQVALQNHFTSATSTPTAFSNGLEIYQFQRSTNSTNLMDTILQHLFHHQFFGTKNFATLEPLSQQLLVQFPTNINNS